MKKTILLFCLIISACHGRRRFIIDKPVDRTFYAYAKISDGTFTIVAKDQHWLEVALKEIGCGKYKVCMIEQTGEVFRVEQKSK